MLFGTVLRSPVPSRSRARPDPGAGGTDSASSTRSSLTRLGSALKMLTHVQRTNPARTHGRIGE
eukprot:5404934-Prymnesium_polylepis.1